MAVGNLNRKGFCFDRLIKMLPQKPHDTSCLSAPGPQTLKYVHLLWIKIIALYKDHSTQITVHRSWGSWTTRCKATCSLSEGWWKLCLTLCFSSNGICCKGNEKQNRGCWQPGVDYPLTITLFESVLVSYSWGRSQSDTGWRRVQE